MPNDFFSAYLKYVSGGEAPTFFHRWSAITGLGAFLGRSYYLPMGNFTVYPNMYTMLIGVPGTRKSTAIKTMKSLLKEAGYSTIAASKTTKEKFLIDLSGELVDENGKSISKVGSDLIEDNLWGTDIKNRDDAETFIMADEFNNFFGNGNIEFISLLGELWDYDGVFESRIKNGKSISVKNPTVSILGGNTPVNFASAFPPEILGQGFFSRLLLIYGEPTGKKIAFPVAPSKEITTSLIEILAMIRMTVVGIAQFTPAARLLAEYIYTAWDGIDDVRFDSYANRRFTHLLKLMLVMSASRGSNEITEQDIVYANTVLTYTEHLMPKALGEFGKAKHAETNHKIIQLLESDTKVFTAIEIWGHVNNDLDKIGDLQTILGNLIRADKIIGTTNGFLAKRKAMKKVNDDIFDPSLLTDEERGNKL